MARQGGAGGAETHGGRLHSAFSTPVLQTAQGKSSPNPGANQSQGWPHFSGVACGPKLLYIVTHNKIIIHNQLSIPLPKLISSTYISNFVWSIRCSFWQDIIDLSTGEDINKFVDLFHSVSILQWNLRKEFRQSEKVRVIPFISKRGSALFNFTR